MMAELVHTASALLIGNELLNGKVREANLQPLAATLRSLGIVLSHVAMVGDDESDIVAELNRLRQRTDILITSGGVGPTHDDITLEAVARAFEVPAVEHPVLSEMLRSHYKDRLTAAHLRMALVPSGAALVSTREVRWPTVRMQNVWVFPGVPELFRMKLVILREHLRGPVQFVSRCVYTRLDEGELKASLDAVVAAFPDVQVGSYPKFMDARYKTKVTFDGVDSELVARALNALSDLLPAGQLAWLE